MPSQLDLGLGALEVGVLLSSTLWGVTTVQLYIYITAGHKDPWWTKALVYIVWILESFHTIFAWIYIYRLTVTYYGVPQALLESTWTLDASSVFDGVIGAIVQMFFAYRIRVFSKSWIITGVCWTGSMLQLATTIAVTVLSPRLSIANFAAKYGWIPEAGLIINLIVDVINTVALSYYLIRERSGFTGTDQILEKLVLWTIETGLITAVAALLQAILFKAEPSTALWIGITLFYAKLYSNSFYAILNSRSSIRQGLSTHVHTADSFMAQNNWGVATTTTIATATQRSGSVRRSNDPTRTRDDLEMGTQRSVMTTDKSHSDNQDS